MTRYDDARDTRECPDCGDQRCVGCTSSAPVTSSRDELIEAMARAEWKVVNPHSPWADTGLRREFLDATSAALPVAVEAVLSRIEAALAKDGPLPAWDVAAEVAAIRAEWGQP